MNIPTDSPMQHTHPVQGSEAVVVVRGFVNRDGTEIQVPVTQYADEYGVFVMAGPEPMALVRHVLSLPTLDQANAFAMGLAADPDKVLAGDRHESLPDEDPTTTELTQYRGLELAEQTALFACAVDMDKVDMDRIEGQSGLYTILAEHALAFCQKHWADSIGVDAYWDAMDWYETSDTYFEDAIAPAIYRSAAGVHQ